MAELARRAASDRDFSAEIHSRGIRTLADIDRFVRSHYRYRDEAEEIVRTPQFMLNDLTRLGYLEGDCDDVATLYAAMSLVIGIPARLVAIRYNPQNPNFEHVFTEAYDGQQWIVLDGTVAPGTRIDSIEDMTEAV